MTFTLYLIIGIVQWIDTYWQIVFESRKSCLASRKQTRGQTRWDELFLVLFSYPIGFSTHPKYVERSVARILFLSAFITMEYSSELSEDKILWSCEFNKRKFGNFVISYQHKYYKILYE